MTPYCPQSPTGAHVWDLPPSDASAEVDFSGPKRESGVCRWCGVEREFTNALLKSYNWGNVYHAKRGGTAKSGQLWCG